jgi:hypothetical protein
MVSEQQRTIGARTLYGISDAARLAGKCESTMRKLHPSLPGTIRDSAGRRLFTEEAIAAARKR